MARKLSAAAVILIWLLVACYTAPATAPGGGNPAVQATAQYRAAEDAGATYQAFSYQATAASNDATRSVLVVTEQARVIANQTASASAATAESQAVRMTESSMAVAATGTALWQSIEGTRQSAVVSATGTAEARKATNDAILAADEARRQAQLRQAEDLRLEGRRVWNNVWPWLVALASALILVLGALFGISFLRRMQMEPIQVITANGRQYPLIQNSGQWQLVSSRSPAREDVPALPEPDGDMHPVPMPSLPDGHVLLLAETEGGKSTTMRAIMKHRQNVVVLDPHYAAGDWPGARVVGGGRNFEEIVAFLTQVHEEMNYRFQRLAEGVTQFPSMTIMTDEAVAIMQSSYGRRTLEIWPELVREARKVDLFLVLSTQSTRVKSLGIEGQGDVLKNFKHQFTLGQMAMDTYPELVEGMERPAVLRSGYSAPRPVIIPYDPNEDPKRRGTAVSSQPQTPLFNAPPVQPGVDTEWGYVDAGQVQMILQMKREGASGREIEEAVFGYPGGYAYHMVKAVLEKCGATATGA